MEPLLLFWLIFLPGLVLPIAESADPIAFNALDELINLCFYQLPFLSLILFLLARDDKLKESGFRRPAFSDLALSFLVFIVLSALSLALGAILARFDSSESAYSFPLPVKPTDWLTLAIGSLAIGYLEETYFRVYLHKRLTALSVSSPLIAFISVSLFAICHLYEGVWGVLNAIAAGIVLYSVYTRKHSVHIIAWAHAAYNMFVFILGANS